MMRRITSLFLATFWLAAVGCRSAVNDLANDTGFGAPETNDETEAPDTDLDVDDAEGDTPRWWSIDGVLQLQEGAIVAEESELRVRTWTAQGGASPSLCDGSPTLVSLTAPGETAPPDLEPPPLAWWRLGFTANEGCLPEHVPEMDGVASFELGLAPFDPRLEPAASATGVALDTDTPNAYALLVREHAESPVWVFGLAQTEGQRANLEPAPQEGPVPDGSYALDTLHLLPLP
jgi:hypothetical protein